MAAGRVFRFRFGLDRISQVRGAYGGYYNIGQIQPSLRAFRLAPVRLCLLFLFFSLTACAARPRTAAVASPFPSSTVPNPSPIATEATTPDLVEDLGNPEAMPTPSESAVAPTIDLPTVEYSGTPQPASNAVVPILMYHHLRKLGDNATLSLKTWTVAPDSFALQLDYLSATGYHTITFAQLLEHFADGVALPSRSIILTFDDGSIEHYSVALPQLLAHGFVGTFFVPTKYAGSPAFMSWDEIRQMDSLGMEFGGHTLNHVDLKRVAQEEAARQLSLSKQQMEHELGHPTIVFAYPYGSFDARVVGEVHEAGYEMAVILCCGYRLRADALLTLPRIRVSYDDSLDQFISRLPSWSAQPGAMERIPR